MAPDKGWAWVVLGASLGANYLNGVLVYFVGVVHTGLLRKFQDSVTTTAWVGALYSSLMCLSAPLASAIISRAGCRVCCVLGGLFCFAGFTASAFVTSVTQLFFTYGLLAGLGLGMTYAAVIITVGYYFDRYRGLASGISSASAAVGILSGSLVAQQLMDVYSVSGAFLMIGALSLHYTLFGMFFRPTPFEKGAVTVSERGVEEGEGAGREEEGWEEMVDIKASTFSLALHGVSVVRTTSLRSMLQDSRRDMHASQQSVAFALCVDHSPKPGSLANVAQVAGAVAGLGESQPGDSTGSLSGLGRHHPTIQRDSTATSIGNLFHSGRHHLIKRDSTSVGNLSHLRRNITVQRGSVGNLSHPGRHVLSVQCGSAGNLSHPGHAVAVTPRKDKKATHVSDHHLHHQCLRPLLEPRENGVTSHSDSKRVLQSDLYDVHANHVQNHVTSHDHTQSQVTSPDPYNATVTCGGSGTMCESGEVVDSAVSRLMECGGERDDESQCGHKLPAFLLQAVRGIADGDTLSISVASDYDAALGLKPPSLVDECEYEDGPRPTSCASKLHQSVAPYLAIVRNRAFMIHCASVLAANINTAGVYLHLPEYAMTYGTSPTEAAALFVAVGTCSLLSRLASGFATTDPRIDPLTLNMGMMGLCGLAAIFFPYYSGTYGGQMVYAGLFGLYTGGQYALVSVLTLQFVPVSRLPAAFGIKIFIMGCGYVVGPPLAALIVDSGWTYEQSFIFLGAMMLFGSVLDLLAIFFAARYKLREDDITVTGMERNWLGSNIVISVQDEDQPRDVGSIVRYQSHDLGSMTSVPSCFSRI